MTGSPTARALHARLRTVAVTGTNGKTTTTSMLAAVVEAAGEPWARVTTLGAWVQGRRLDVDTRMAGFLSLAEEAASAGVRTLAVECTSRSLAGGFARRWPPQVAVLTNLTRDHLDRHGSVEAYLAAKAQLFLALPPGGVAVWNAGDPASALLDEVVPSSVERRGWLVGERHPAGTFPVALAAETVESTRAGTLVRLRSSPLAERLGGSLRLSVLGPVQALNALAAAVAADAAGYPADAIRAGIERFAGVPGRFEVVSRRPLVVVDYAHTPDALARSLAGARALVAADGGEVWCVFGCGGDRDRGKRPQMGALADAGADHVILTNDNPRGEDPEAIADEVAGGAAGAAGWSRQLDRAVAIRRAVTGAAPRDAVLIAGKGHESVQIFGSGQVPFSDVEVAQAALGCQS